MMKQTIFLISVLLSVWMVSCNRIDQDEYQLDYTPSIPEGADVRKILLEDYTGMQCSNCPRAAEKARTLMQAYGERLIVVSVHAGYFSRPLGGVDLRTPAGDAYNAYFKISGNPQGVVNRTSYKEAAYYSMYQWEEVIRSIPSKSPASLDLELSYDAQMRLFSLDMSITRYHPYAGNGLDLVIWLVEDSIPTQQIMGDASLSEYYMQQHVLRGALNGIWGEPISLPEQNGEHIRIQKEKYVLPETYKAKDCSIVAFLCEHSSKEIIQVNSVPFIE